MAPAFPGVETPGYYQPSLRDMQSESNMARVLVIAYGNPLRSDDGVALRVADGLEETFSADDVEIVRPQQLGPELAEAASRSRLVIFVDAAAGSGRAGEIKISELDSNGSLTASPFGHALPPSVIVRLAAQLYGARPQAINATITGQNFEHGDALSSAVAEAVPLLIGQLEELIRHELMSANSLTTKDTK